MRSGQPEFWKVFLRPSPPDGRLLIFFAILPSTFFAQTAIPQTISDSVGDTLRYVEGQLLSIAEAMPEANFSFIPSAGNFADARSFAEQLKHVACTQFTFFEEVGGKAPPEACERGGPSEAATKAELIQYLRDSFDYGNRVLATMGSSSGQPPA